MTQDNDHSSYFPQVLQSSLEAIIFHLQACLLTLIQSLCLLPVPTMHALGSATLTRAQTSLLHDKYRPFDYSLALVHAAVFLSNFYISTSTLPTWYSAKAMSIVINNF